MAYYTGTATSNADLIDKIATACTANGWSKDTSGSATIVYKGGCYFELGEESWSRWNDPITLHAGTGKDGGGNLTGRADTNRALLGIPGRFGPDSVNDTVEFTYSTTYEIFLFTNPDEVYVVLTYGPSDNVYQQAAFGISSIPGMTGTGAWFAGAKGSDTTSSIRHYKHSDPLSYKPSGGIDRLERSSFAFSLFGGAEHGVDHGFDSTWSTYYYAPMTVSDLWTRIPSAFNSETILMPVRTWYQTNAGNAFVTDLKNMRYVDMTTVSDGQILVIGNEKWKCYPMARRSLRRSEGGSESDGSGMNGHAFRYDGP